MKLGLSIERDGSVVSTRQLGPGEYGIGRTPENAVVLPDPAVSSRHALLRVGEKTAELVDMESLNGIFLDGRKVGKITIGRALEVDICDYRLRFSPKADRRRLLPAMPALNQRLAILVATAFLALAGLSAAWLPGMQAMTEARLAEGLRRGALLARFLAEQNVLPLRAKLLDQVRTTPISAEDGVRQAFVADPYGKILAPPKDLGKGLDSPEALAAAREPGISLWTEASGETFVAAPIRDDAGVLGVAVIAYDPDRAVPPLALPPALAVGAACVAVLWLLVAVGLVRLTLRPVRRLAEDIGVALKSGAGALSFVPPSREYAELKRAAERLLVLVPPSEPSGSSGPGRAAAAAAARATPPGAPWAARLEPSGTPDGEAQAAMPGEAGQDWCVLELDSFLLTGWSPAFTAHLAAPDLAPPVHLLTALADPALLAAVAGVVEDPSPQAARQVEGRRAAASKGPGPKPGTVRVAITEAT
ncbi:FHA domain-containing protein [Desulfolutivibrio sulfoxidireducens]|uniref:FHA domain-containing protein n=1 Tax=Desulfolutivibrio sulfoxidireducens TaxID=2773299 RepID=UPI00159D0A8A|nr:FHA domain-containing protein [Desulfolutivibrio sulfoxidireducens]QLA14665.1 FHA domain-containing protein [Desulfolutivibrio sulfoxidireducens]QLA18246.1 FHA domain-containing protein [Desulfolutivibrio sulfoxidireducens]